jgi:hypothetical protein
MDEAKMINMKRNSPNMSYNDQWVKAPFKHPSLSARNKILDQYYKNLEVMDRIDAYVSYNTSMHFLYCKDNPHLKYQGYDKKGRHILDKDGNPKLRRLLTREDFIVRNDRFGFPLWVNDLSPELFERWAAGEDVPRPRKKN